MQKNYNRFKNVLLLFCGCVIFSNNLFAITTTATAVGGGTWATATWSNGVPTAAMDAVINSGINLTIGTAAVCGSLTIGNATNTATTLTLGAGGTLVVSGTTGNLILNPSNVNKAFTLAVATQTVTIAGGVTYPTTGTSSITMSTGSFTISSLLTLAASDVFTFTGAGIANFNGGLSDGAGSLTTFNGCTVNMGGDYTVTNSGVTWVAGSTCIFVATLTVTPTTAITFDNVQLSTGTVTLAGSVTVNGNWTNNGGTLSGGANTVTLAGTGKTIGGTTTTAFPALSIASLATRTMNTDNSCTGLTFAASSSASSLTHGSTSALTVNGNVTINNPSGGGTTAWNINAGSSIVTGNVTIGSGGSNSSRIANITVTTGTLTISGNLTYSVGGAASGVMDLSGGAATVNLAGTFTLSSNVGTLTPGTTSTFNYNGSSAAQTVRLISAITYNDLNLNNTNAAGATLSAAVSAANVTGNISVQSGLFSNGGFAIVGNAGKTFSVSNGATFQLTTTTGMVTGFGTKTFGTSSTVNYSGTTQSVSSESYGHLLLNGSLTKTAAGPITVNGDLTITTSTQFNGGTSQTHTFYGNWIVNTSSAVPFTFTTSSTVTFNAPVVSAATSISGSTAGVVTFNVVNINNTNGFNVNHDFSASGNLTIASNVSVTPGASNIISGTGTLTGNGTVYVTRTASTPDFLTQYSISGRTLTNITVNYNAASAQTVSAVDYGNLTITANGTRTITLASSGTIGIAKVFSPTLTNTTYVVTGSNVNFNGSTAQVIGTAFTFYDLSLANAAGLSLNANVDLIDALTISSGTFTSTGYSFTLKSTSSGTARIAAIPGGSDFVGNIIMERYSGTGPTDWRFLSPAVSGSTIADWADDFATSGFTGATCNPSNCGTAGCSATCNWPSIYTYDETVAGTRDNGYVAATNVTNSTSNGKGFWVYLGANPITFEVTGSPNKFSQSPTVTYSSSAGINEDGWNMIANPYPSAIDWDDVNWTKTNIDNAVYIYNSSNGSYASYVNGSQTNGGTRYIASQQSFWVKANAASPVITMVENVKASANPVYLKTGYTPNTSRYPIAFQDFPIPANTNNYKNTIKLTVRGNGYDDETVIRFVKGASEKFDSGFDAWKIQNPNTDIPNISSVVNDSADLSINSLSELNADVSIPMRLLVPKQGAYSIRRDSILMLETSSCIFLEDLVSGSMTDLRSSVSYSFTISDTTKVRQFILHIYAPITKKAVNTNCPDQSKGMAIAKGTGVGPWTYTWKDENGKILKTTSNSFIADTLFNLAPGIYSVQVPGTVCGLLTDTIIIRSNSNMSLTSDFTDVSCNGKSDGYVNVILTGGHSPYSYLWNNGNTTSSISNLPPGEYSVIVTDSIGCVQTKPFSISQPEDVVAAFTAPDTLDLAIDNSISFVNNSTGATSFLWDFGDNSASVFFKDTTHVYLLEGLYTVMLIASNGNCADTVFKPLEVINSNPLDIHNINNSASVNVFHNNGKLLLKFNLSEMQDVSINIYSSVGEKIMSQGTKSAYRNEMEISLADFTSGIYLVAVEMKDAIIVRKLFINKINTMQ